MTELCSSVITVTNHGDMIHDIAYNHFGDRMVTCSSDQNMKIWDLDEETKTWKCTKSWKAHRATIWRVDWAHPDFGQVIAACSFDRTATIWEESVSEISPGNLMHEWNQKGNLVDSRTAIKDIEFAPKHLGLQLATCTSDGVVRIYEAPDVVNLTQWVLQEQINIGVSCCCLTWNTSVQRVNNPMIAVGSDNWGDSPNGKVFVFEYNENIRDWMQVYVIKDVSDSINDLKFSPDVGRTYHILAVAASSLHLYKMELGFLEDESENIEADDASDTSNLKVDKITVLNDHDCNVLRLSWNRLGTMLTSSGDDGKVLMWMTNYLGIWKKVNDLKVA